MDINVFLKSFTNEKVSSVNELTYALLLGECSQRNVNKSLKLRRPPKIAHTISLVDSGIKFRNIKCQKNTHIPPESAKMTTMRNVKSSCLKYSFTILFPPNKKCVTEATHRKTHSSDCCDTTPDTQESMLKRACIFTKVKMHTSLSCQTYGVVSHKYFITAFPRLQHKKHLLAAATQYFWLPKVILGYCHWQAPFVWSSML